jgi:hypothetical protein
VTARSKAEQQSFETQQAVIDAIIATKKQMKAEINRQAHIIFGLQKANDALSEAIARKIELEGIVRAIPEEAYPE